MEWTMRSRVDALDLRSPVVVSPGEPLRAAARTLWVEDVGAVVVAEGTRAVGILSERDIAGCVARGDDPETMTVGEAMSTRLIAVRPNDTLHDAAYEMLDGRVRHLPVVDDADRVVGMLSIRDLLRPMITDEIAP
jgi:CBS domain-containing protein